MFVQCAWSFVCVANSCASSTVYLSGTHIQRKPFIDLRHSSHANRTLNGFYIPDWIKITESRLCQSKANSIFCALFSISNWSKRVLCTLAHTHTFGTAMDVPPKIFEVQKIFDTDKIPLLQSFHCCCSWMMSLFMFLLLSHKRAHRTDRISSAWNVCWIACFPSSHEDVICERPNVSKNMRQKDSWKTIA